MAEQSNTPQLRFQGYTDAWGQVKLGEILQEFSEKSVIENQYPLLSSTNTGIEYRDGRVSGEHNVGYKIIDQGDLVFSPQNLWLGNININHLGRGMVSPSYKTMKIVNYEAGFLEPILRSEHMLNQYKLASIQGASVVRRNLDPALFDEIEVPYPGLEEQRKVAAIFEQMESAVALHQRKLDKLQAIKKSLLQKMFPAEGEDRPQIRFAGYTDAWGQESFASVFDFLSNNTLSRAKLTEEGGEVKDVHYGDVLIKFGEVLDPSKESIPFVSSLEKKSIPSKDFLKDGDVIIADTAEDATVGKCTEIVNSNGYSLVSGLHTFPIRPRKAFGKGYLGFYMNSNSYHNQLVPYMQGIKVTSLSRSAMLNTTIAYPKDISEQEKIGGAFFQIDSLLSLHQRKLYKLQEIKKALLQKMFC